MSETTVTVFDHALLNSKSFCTMFLREFGIQRDWARCSLSEMRQMLKGFSDEKMFSAAKKIVEREGDVFIRSEYEVTYEVELSSANDSDDSAEFTPPAPAPTPAPAPVKPAAPVPAPAPVAPAKPKPTPQAEPDAGNVTEVATLLAKLMTSSKPALDVDAVTAIALEVVTANNEEIREDMANAIKVVSKQVTQAVAEAIKNVAPREIKITTKNSEVVIDGLQHFAFERLLRSCSAVGADGHRLNVWLYGPPGTGKTTGARNVAKALGTPFYCTGALLTKYDITGFVDAGGRLVRTPFRDAWENGGVYLFDEIDGSAPAAVVAFNAALANGIMAFPDGMVERHADCVVIAAANTTGLGATAEFTGRTKLDMATLDRFVFLEWAIDEKIESALSSSKEWARIVQKVRANVAAKGVKGVSITPRATLYGCSLLAAGLSMDDVKAMVLRKSMSADQWSMVAA